MKKIFIKLIYFIPLASIIFICISNFGKLSREMTLGIPNLFAFLPLIIIFTYQLIRNSIVGWASVMFLYLLFLVTYIKDIIRIYKFELTYGSGPSKEQILSLSLYILLILGVGVIYLMARPKEKII